MSELKKPEPLIKWAGGKRQLLDKIVDKLPKEFNNYYEPFIGGGAVLFGLSDLLADKEVTINDINKELVNLYKVVKNNHLEFIKLLEKKDKAHDEALDKKEFYLKTRKQYNDMILFPDKYNDEERASTMVYINKHCFNGLYRVNSKGLFNVPFNNKKSGQSYSIDNVLAVSDFLNVLSNNKGLNIMLGDFEKAVKTVQKKDFVFFDSPYAPLSGGSFESYAKEGFSYNEHVRLAKLFKELSNKGVYCMLTNHNTDLINELYKDYNIEVVLVKRMINSDATNRVGEEVIITNY